MPATSNLQADYPIGSVVVCVGADHGYWWLEPGDEARVIGHQARSVRVEHIRTGKVAFLHPSNLRTK